MKKKIVLLVLMLCMMISATVSAAGRSGVVTLEIDLTAQEIGKEAKLWIPYPVSDRQCGRARSRNLAGENPVPEGWPATG